MGLRAASRLATAIALLVVAGCGSGETVAPEPGTTVPGDQFSASGDMLVVGDWGSGTDSQDRVAEAMADYAAGREIAAILTTGDNFYSDNVDDLMEPFAWATDDDIPFLVAWGNHDVESETRIELMNDVFDDPPRWVHHEWGSVDIVILDSTQLEDARQLDFLERSLESTEDPTIVVFHHPRYSCGTHGDTPGMDAWVDAFDDDVFLALAGHEHNYQRFQADGVSYVVTGGGGRSLTGLADCPADHPERLAGEETFHFMVLELDDTLEATAIDADGDVLDEFSIGIP